MAQQTTAAGAPRALSVLYPQPATHLLKCFLPRGYRRGFFNRGSGEVLRVRDTAVVLVIANREEIAAPAQTKQRESDEDFCHHGAPGCG